MASVSWSIVVLLFIVDGTNIVVGCDYGLDLSCPGKSCLDIYHNNSSKISGKYIIRNGNQLQFVYCDMELECGGEKGWMRIANINITNGDSCPNGWKITSHVSACRARSDNAGCYSVHFSTHNIPYSRVCGMIVGYQQGTTDGFATYNYSTRSINGPYVDGVSITYGTPRKHIWTYGIGKSDKSKVPLARSNCPCAQHPGQLPPSFVHDNYYCESGSLTASTNGSYYLSDPVWDGKDCSNENSCCSDPSLPWFYRQLPLISNENLEARICYDQIFSDEAVLVKEIQLYVQ